MSNSTDWSHWIAARLYDHRWTTLIVALLVTGAAVVPALQVGVDTAVQHWFTEGDPALESYRDFQATYGNDEVVLIGLRDPDGLLTGDGFSTLKTASERVRAVDGVASVQSLATQPRVQTTLAGPQLVPLMGADSLTSSQAEALRSRVLRDSTYARFVSEDGTMAAVYARMKRNAAIDGRRGAILDSIRRTLTPLDAPVHLAGTGVILDAINEAAMEDSFLFVLASSLLIYLLLWGYLRRIGPVLLTLGVVGTATIWLMGIYGLAGKNINMVTVVMPTLVMVVAVADCVHLLVYAAELPASLSPRERTVQTLGDLLTPCLLTTLTTAAGFASLTTSSMAIVRTLGIFSAIGVGAGLLAAFIGAAVALPYDAVLPNQLSEGRLQRIVDGTVALGLRRWRPVLVGTVLLLIAAGVGLTHVQADTNPIGYLFPDHPVRQDSDRIEQTLGAYAPLEFIVRADSSALDPALLQSVAQWQDRAVATGAVRWHQSPVDDLRRLHAAIPNGASTVPSSPNRVSGLVQLGADALPYLSDLQDHPQQLRVTFGMLIQSAAGIRSTIETVRDVVHLPDGVTLEPTGYLPLYVRMMSLLTESLATSFGLALLVILTVIGLLFRSVQAALLSLLPNGLPVLLALGLMGWLAIPLDAATMTIAAVVFGLVVDDTIHLLHRYTTALDGASPVSAVRTSARQTGRRMAVTTSVLAGGFLVLCLAQIKSIVWLGLLSAVAVGAALLADLLVLPAVLAGVYGREETA
jgi:predicted RND superfamily exporter protein